MLFYVKTLYNNQFTPENTVILDSQLILPFNLKKKKKYVAKV